MLQAVDFSFVRAEVEQFYGYNGHRSVDPVVLIKLMFLLFYDNVASERELMSILPERLDYLWFIGYGLDDTVPDHSVLSKARARWGVDVFKRLFVHTIEHLTERDLIVLKIINEVMNRKDDWKPQHDSANPAAPIMKLHHSNIISRAQEFARRVAMALGQPVEKNLYNRDVGFEICARLEGFGLAHQLSPMTELPVTDYAYRLSGRGATLLMLLGEGVPNAHHYTSLGR